MYENRIFKRDILVREDTNQGRGFFKQKAFNEVTSGMVATVVILEVEHIKKKENLK
jgi:hypothetical protein